METVQLSDRKHGPTAILLLDPARSVIERVGGVEEVAKLTGRHPSRVRRWATTKEKGGTDGLIPTREALKLVSTGQIKMDEVVEDANTLAREDLRILTLLMDGHDTRSIARAVKLKEACVKAGEAKLRANSRVSADVWPLVERRRAKARSGKASK